jgi:hypothetical protein
MSMSDDSPLDSDDETIEERIPEKALQDMTSEEVAAALNELVRRSKMLLGALDLAIMSEAASRLDSLFPVLRVALSARIEEVKSLHQHLLQMRDQVK